jgi:Mlc titration factor MtfA (ptsG expression regulator)
VFYYICDWLNRRVIARSKITAIQWEQAFASIPLLYGLTTEEKKALTELAILFMHHKTFEAKHGLQVTEQMLLTIALQACLPILKLGLNCYRNWYTVIIYPSVFVARNIIRDEAGVEHHVHSELTGEAWHRGPVVLAWDKTAHAGEIDGHNLVIHEFAHKLDMQNGIANGFPPLHRGMSRQAWVNAFTAGYSDFQEKQQRGINIGIDSYAATAPAEYFAVLSEVFFERPALLAKHYPDIYDQLVLYYKQDPFLRLG